MEPGHSVPGLTLTHGPVLGSCQVSILGVQEAVPRLTDQLLPVVAEVVGDTGEEKGATECCTQPARGGCCTMENETAELEISCK